MKGELAALGFGSATFIHAELEQMKFRLADGALETEQEAIVQRIGVINSLAVPEQGIAQGADLEQLVPVAARASKAGHLHAEHDADMAQSDLSHEALEAQASLG